MVGKQAAAGETALPPVAKHVLVPASAERAFAVFTEHPTDWWPAEHILVPPPREEIVFEPRPGGRWYERSGDGTERDWGRVVVWSPPRRLVLTWQIDGRWQPVADPAKASEIEVTFRQVDEDTTAVELAHVKLHRHGADARAIRAAIDGPSPGLTLANFASAVAAAQRGAAAGREPA
jgi:uncharacterized protein YndB with AHSA1/START domain